MSAAYTFRTGKGDDDVDKIIDAWPSSVRSRNLRDAVRFYAGWGDEMRRLSQRVEGLFPGGLVAVEQQKREANVDMGDMLVVGITDTLG